MKKPITSMTAVASVLTTDFGAKPMSREQVASALGLTVPQVRVIERRAVGKLQRKLGRRLGSDFIGGQF